LVCQKRFIERVQQHELGAEVLGEGRCPTHDVAPDPGIIHRGQNPPGGLAYPVINNECRDGKSANQALEGTAPASVQSLASEHYKLRTKGCGRFGQALDRRADSHLYRYIPGAERPGKAAQSRQKARRRCRQTIVKSGHRWPQEPRYFGDRQYVSELDRALLEVCGGPPRGCE
jgi:hypothetical protein